MRVTHAALAAASLLLLAAPPVAAEPPSHAPAHGYRAKQHPAKRKPAPTPERHGGFEVVFDSERGVRVAVGFPDVFFSAGHFYRHHDGHWQVSARADDGWSRIARDKVPGPIHQARMKKRR